MKAIKLFSFSIIFAGLIFLNSADANTECVFAPGIYGNYIGSVNYQNSLGQKSTIPLTMNIESAHGDTTLCAITGNIKWYWSGQTINAIIDPTKSYITSTTKQIVTKAVSSDKDNAIVFLANIASPTVLKIENGSLNSNNFTHPNITSGILRKLS